MKILVGMSGGVDSSTTALLLKEQGHEVIGACMSIWGKSDLYKEIQKKLNSIQKKSTHSACLGPNQGENVKAAKKICDEIGIEFYSFDCSKEYEEIVLNNFKKEYLTGRTPNPCVWCNSLIKFNVLPNVARMNGIEYDKFATGHYAKIEEENGRYIIKRGVNPKKDQSYFLYRLSQEQLKNIILPLGNFTKEEIRDKARSFNLEVADKPDSQDFYEGDYNDILQMEDKIGNIVDTNGKILGEHKGFWHYTIGQRKGLMISAKEPLYVLKLNSDKNEVVVGFKDKTMNSKLSAIKLNWVKYEKPEKEFECLAKIRSTQEPTKAKVKIENDDKIIVEFENLQKSIATGQSVVLYENDAIIGGGIINEVID